MESVCIRQSIWLVVYIERAHICRMTNVKVTCNCGAIYEVIETKGPSRDPKPFKCVLCEKELFAWRGLTLDSSGLSRVPRRIDSNAKLSHGVGAHVAEGHGWIIWKNRWLATPWVGRTGPALRRTYAMLALQLLHAAA